MSAVRGVTKETRRVTAWRRSIAEYTDRRVLLILPLGFASGLPLLLTFSTLSAWFAKSGVSLKTIGAFALVGTPYAFKFLWSPLIDRLPPPIPLGRRRGWGITIQLALDRRDARAGLMQPQGRSRAHGSAGAAGGVPLCEPGRGDRRVPGRNPDAGAAGSRRRNDPDGIPNRDAGLWRRRADYRGARGLVRGLRHDGGVVGSRAARVHLRTRAGDAARGTAAYRGARMGGDSRMAGDGGRRTVRRLYAAAGRGRRSSFSSSVTNWARRWRV